MMLQQFPLLLHFHKNSFNILSLSRGKFLSSIKKGDIIIEGGWRK